MDGVLSRPRPQAEGFLKDDTTATLATRMFATMTGSEWMSTPYNAHKPAAIPWTRRNAVGVLVKYETRKTAVASQPIQSTCVIMPAPLEREAFPQRERPALPLHALPEPVTERQLRGLASHRARRTEAQRYSRITTLSCRLVAIPRATVIEERGEAQRHQPQNVVGDENPILEHEPRRARAGEGVDPE